jgi:hypothetical protein
MSECFGTSLTASGHTCPYLAASEAPDLRRGWPSPQGRQGTVERAGLVRFDNAVVGVGDDQRKITDLDLVAAYRHAGDGPDRDEYVVPVNCRIDLCRYQGAAARMTTLASGSRLSATRRSVGLKIRCSQCQDRPCTPRASTSGQPRQTSDSGGEREEATTEAANQR